MNGHTPSTQFGMLPLPMTNRWLRRALGPVCAIVALPAACAADCTREEAFNKMMAFNPVAAQLQQEWSDSLQSNPNAANAKLARIKTLSEQMGAGSQLLAAEKYGEACTLYDKLASQFGVSFAESKTLTMKQLVQDGGRGPGGRCDLTEAALRMKTLTEHFEKSAKEGTMTEKKQHALSRRFNEIGVLMSSDPSAACDAIDKTAKEYGWE